MYYWDSDGARAVLIITWKDAGIWTDRSHVLAGGDSIDFVWKPEKEPDEQMICADSIYYPFRMIYKESNDCRNESFFAVIGLSKYIVYVSLLDDCSYQYSNMESSNL